MRNMKLLPALVGTTVVIAVILYIAFYFIFLDLFVDLWWFESLKLESYFWLKLLYKFFLSGGITLLFFTIFFFHFWIASSYLGLNPPNDVFTNIEKRRNFQNFANIFVNGSIKIYTPISFILAIFVAIPFYNQWETSLLYFFGSNSGVTESVYGNDVSFYMLFYPLYILIQKELLITAVLVFIMVALLYWLEHVFVPHQRREYNKGAKIHLIILISFVVLFVIWGFLLKRFSLLYTNSHEPIFYGPGAIEIRYQLPLIWLGITSFLATAIAASLFIFSEKHRIKTPLLISALAFSGILVLSDIQLIPELIQKYIVNPNPVKAEKSFMQHNIDATLNAYSLNNINTIELDIKLDATDDIASWSTQKHFENIPVWDREYLLDSYKQLQEIRPYYQINNVDEDRYFILDHIRQVNLAAREINISKIPKEAQNWENTHLRYTHGYGAITSPAAQDADNPLMLYLRDLNMYSDVGISVKNPDIYFGEEPYNYAIVPNKLKVVGLEKTDSSLEKDYDGDGGIPISSYLKKILLAVYFKDEKIFFSSNMSTQSQLLMRRNIVERVNQITPFLHLDKDPYLVMTKDRFYWVLDAYTLSDKYPIATPTVNDNFTGVSKFNYIRNSVKIIVDAFEGHVDYYITDDSDAIVKAYSKAYPSLFKTLQDMPIELKQHLRYPRDLFYTQMKLYAKYHQNTPELFYEQGETWQFANVRNQIVMPYYQTMDFGNCNNKEEFVLINPMTPVNRNNLSMLGVASIVNKDNCNLEYNPNITIYKFGKDVQVNGPAQVEALIDQDSEISEQITLWDQHGSTVQMGRMVILPMGNTVLYVQPIYLTSTKVKMPELTRVIVSIGNEVVMDKTLWSAFQRLKSAYIKHASEKSKTGTANITN